MAQKDENTQETVNTSSLVTIGGEKSHLDATIYKEKENVSPYDIFRLAKGILIVAILIYVGLACVRMFYTGINTEAVKEVWEYSKVVLNSIISLVLGLYFGSSQRK